MRACILVILLFPATLNAQKIVSRTSKVTFFSDAVIEDITATTTKANGIIDLSKAEFAFSIPIQSFEFDKSLMKEHFNEKYMESDKFPKATFVGNMIGFDPEAPSQEVKASGKMSIHGVSREVTIPAVMKKDGSTYAVSGKFIVTLKHYDIEIPQLLFQNIAESVEVTVDFVFKPQ